MSLIKVEECAKNIRYRMLRYFLNLILRQKTKRLKTAKRHFFDCVVTLDGPSVTSFAAEKDLGVIIDFRLLFEGHVNNISTAACSSQILLRNIIQKPACASVPSKLEFCHALLHADGCSIRCISKGHLDRLEFL